MKKLPNGLKSVREAKGRRAVTLHEISNGFVIIPAGTEVTIDGRSVRVGVLHGVHITCDPCKCCKVRAHVSGVSIHSLHLLEVQK